jgi:hypothetical protein
MPPLVSIVIPCHVKTAAEAALLGDTLDSVAAQSTPAGEVLLVDDGSPWSIDAVAADRSKVTLLPQPQAGPALARNRGIGASRGDYLIFLDADDLLLPDAIGAGLAALAGHPGAGFAVGPREEMTYEGQAVPWVVPPPPPQQRLYLPLLAFEWYIIPPSSVMFRRNVVATLGGFRDPWGADDLDFYLRAAYRYDAHCYQRPAVTRYRRYSTSSSRDGERMLHSVRAVYDRQRPLVEGDPAAEAAFQAGLQRLTAIFVDCLVENVHDRLRSGDPAGARRSAALLAIESPSKWRALLDEPVVGAALGADSSLTGSPAVAPPDGPGSPSRRAPRSAAGSDPGAGPSDR